MGHLVLSTLASIVALAQHAGANTDPTLRKQEQALTSPAMPERTAGCVIVPEMPQTVIPTPLGVMIPEIDIADPFGRIVVEEQALALSTVFPAQLVSGVSKLLEKAGEPDNVEIGGVWSADVAARLTPALAKVRTLAREEQARAHPTCLPLQLSVAQL